MFLLRRQFNPNQFKIVKSQLDLWMLPEDLSALIQKASLAIIYWWEVLPVPPASKLELRKHFKWEQKVLKEPATHCLSAEMT